MGNELERILQLDIRRGLIPQLGQGAWIPAYGDLGTGSGVFCALVPSRCVRQVLSSPHWDLCKGDGGPEISAAARSGHKYSRLSGGSGIEPLVLLRTFDDLRPAELELSEEYRLFHNLFRDQGTGEFIRMFEDGSEEVAGRITGETCELRLRDLRQYLAIRRMHLAVYFQVWRTSRLELEDLPARCERIRDESTCYDFFIKQNTIGLDPEAIKTVSKTVGKKLIPPLTLKSCGIWPYKPKEPFEDFIIGTGEDGHDIMSSCDPALLADSFGRNQDAPNYLTPVFFRREVLTRYYSNPSKYIVHDGRVQCGSKWVLPIDNNHPNLVSVALGDLGRDLPSKERLYWKAHNVPGDGAKISDVHFRRNVLAEFTDAQALDLAFKAAYEKCHRAWEKRFGWRLFRPLHKSDEHCLSTLHRLLADQQSEFDEQVKNLSKLLVDSINDEALQAGIGPRLDDEKSIAKLRRWFERAGQPRTKQHVAFLQNLQAIRSTGAVHGKGSGYERLMKKLGYQGVPLSRVLDDILATAATMLDELRRWVESPAAESSTAGDNPPTA